MTFRQTVETLMSAGIESARAEAAILFERFCGVTGAELPLVYDKEFVSPELSKAIEKRVLHIPLQYIIGRWDFFGLELEVNEACLCPRPDTEILVETSLLLLPLNASFLELCTGSGCISIALCNARQDLRGIATDKFQNTLKVAVKNAENHSVIDRLSLIQADLFEEPDYIGDKKFNAIISNPPYIKSGEIVSLSPEVRHEPLAALDGGADGLDFYRHIVGNYAKYLSKDGIMIFEIGFDQGRELCDIADDHGYTCEIIKDLEKNDRVAVVKVR